MSIEGYVRERSVLDDWAKDREAPPGFHVVIVDELQRPGSGWVLLPYLGRCRYVIDGQRHSCKRPGRFGLNRGYGHRRYPWVYCDEHLYGRHHEIYDAGSKGIGHRLLAAILASNDEGKSK